MNVSHKKIGLGVVALAIALAGSAVIADAKDKSAPGPGPMGMMHPAFDFAAADTNKDGKISADEFAAYRATTAVALDADKDGKLSVAELTAMDTKDTPADALAKATAMVKNFDTDGDGKLSAAELLTMPQGYFDMADTNKDGVVDQAEADAMAKMMMHGPGGKQGKHHKGTGDQPAPDATQNGTSGN